MAAVSHSAEQGRDLDSKARKPDMNEQVEEQPDEQSEE